MGACRPFFQVDQDHCSRFVDRSDPEGIESRSAGDQSDSENNDHFPAKDDCQVFLERRLAGKFRGALPLWESWSVAITVLV